MTSEESEPINLKTRSLCTDGNCIGTIGQDGHCRVCGLEGELPTVAAEASDESDEDDPFDQLEDEGRDAAPPDLDSRRLCPDGNCIGILGDDGHCRVCGLP